MLRYDILGEFDFNGLGKGICVDGLGIFIGIKWKIFGVGKWD